MSHNGGAPALLHAARSDGRVAHATRFVWHFVQMAMAMMVGMAPLCAALAVSDPHLETRSPEAYALAMTVSMTLPMVGWMRLRGHSWERAAEMSAAIAAPVVVAVAGSLIGLFPHRAALSVMGAAMWLGMLGVMLVRRREYAQSGHGHAIPGGADA